MLYQVSCLIWISINGQFKLYIYVQEYYISIVTGIWWNNKLIHAAWYSEELFLFYDKKTFSKKKICSQSPSNEFLFTFTHNASFFDKGNVENTKTGSHLGFQWIGETGHEQSQLWSAAMPLQARRQSVSFWILADSCVFPRDFYFF